MQTAQLSRAISFLAFPLTLLFGLSQVPRLDPEIHSRPASRVQQIAELVPPPRIAVNQPKPKPKLKGKARKHAARTSVAYRKVLLSGVPVHVVQIDVSNPYVRLKPLRARDLGTTYRTFGSFMRKAQPLAAINGTFFDTISGEIICNLVRDGQLLSSGSVGQTLAVDRGRSVHYMPTAGKAGGRYDWKNSEFAVSSGPTLVRSGRVELDPRSEGFSDPGLFRLAARAGIGVTSKRKLLLVTVNQPISLGRFARIMQKLGAQNALNLDGGSSTGLYAGGRYLSRPARKLTNVLLVTIRADG